MDRQRRSGNRNRRTEQFTGFLISVSNGHAVHVGIRIAPKVIKRLKHNMMWILAVLFFFDGKVAAVKPPREPWSKIVHSTEVRSVSRDSRAYTRITKRPETTAKAPAKIMRTAIRGNVTKRSSTAKVSNTFKKRGNKGKS